jgi:hypothetical protein
MKKLLLILLFSTISYFGNAQVIYSQDFTSTTSLSTMTLINADGDAGAAANWVRTEITTGNNGMASFSWYNAPLTPDNYAFTPAINLTNVSGIIKLSWKHGAPNTNYDKEKYSVYVTTAPTTAAALATTPVFAVTSSNGLDGVNTPTEVTVDLSSYAGQTIHVGYRHHGVTDEFAMYIDDIQVKRLQENDLQLVSVNVPYIINGNFTFNGTVKNLGSNTVNSYQVTWSSGGAVNTHNVTGVSIASGATHDFTHSVPLNAVVDQSYALNFNVALVNGLADPDTSNNTLLRNTKGTSGTTTYKPMFEKFTSSTCPPCASYNNSTFNPFYAAQNQNFNLVSYHMNYPGNSAAGFPNGDPYYKLEAETRHDFYGVTGITHLRINGVSYSTNNNQATLTTHMNTEAAKPSAFVLNAGREIVANTATVNYTITPYLSGNYTLHAAVIEKTTTGNVGSNGETSFKHVMMKMVPNASGTAITTTAGTPISGQISASLAGTFIEEVSDLEVIVFLQDNVTKQVMQSKTAQVGLLSNDSYVKNKINIFPNPANDFIQLSNIDQANIVITDMTGKVVLNQNNVSEDASINISNLTSGVYFVSVNTENIQETIKFIKK